MVIKMMFNQVTENPIKIKITTLRRQTIWTPLDQIAKK